VKVGLIAGSGELPLAVLEGCTASKTELHIIALTGTPTDLPADAITKTVDPAKLGKITRHFKRAGCTHICFAGHVSRPDFGALKPDLKGLRHLPSVLLAAKRGDDALLSTLISSFENDGFKIIAPQELCAHILMPEGFLGQAEMTAEHKDDSEKACRIARQIGAMDIGQAAVVCDGLVLAVEAQEGTDAMLRRVAELPQNLRGSRSARKGVLAKMIKPGQETRVDLPSIGPKTIALADDAGLAGIVTEGGGSFVFSREEVARQADALGIFVAGLPSSKG
jgi:DUF1009 family protein